MNCLNFNKYHVVDHNNINRLLQVCEGMLLGIGLKRGEDGCGSRVGREWFGGWWVVDGLDGYPKLVRMCLRPRENVWIRLRFSSVNF